jgi:conjugal transfer ATP-binding protein TraC
MMDFMTDTHGSPNAAEPADGKAGMPKESALKRSLRDRLKSLWGTVTPNFENDSKESAPRLGAPCSFDRFSSFLPYAHMGADNLCAITTPDERGFEGLGFVFEVRPQTGTTPFMAGTLLRLFGEDAPKGTGVQATLFGSPFVAPILSNLEASCARAKETDTPERKQQLALMQRIAHRRAEFLGRGARQKIDPRFKNRFRNFRAWVAVVVPTENPFDEEVRAKVLRLSEMVSATLTQAHFAPWMWNEDVFVNTLSQLLNPHQMEDGSWLARASEAGTEPRRRMLSPDTHAVLSESGLAVGRRGDADPVCLVGMSARSYPETLDLAQVTQLAGATDGKGAAYPCPFLITTLASLGKFDAQKATATLKSARAEQLAGTELARVLPALKEEASDWRIALQSFEHGEGLVRLSHQVLLMPRASERLEATESARAVFRLLGIELTVDEYMHLQGVFATLPMMAGPLLAKDIELAKRSSTKTCANAANTLPLVADWTGTPPRAGKSVPTSLLNFTSRRGQILSVDPFANPNGNYNGVVVGASGSGKSVLLNELALGTLRTGGRVWVIDVGRSYEKLCSLVGGQWLEFASGKGGVQESLNPFSLVTDLETDMDLMLPLLEQMVSPSKPLDDLALSHLLIHFRATWKRFKKAGRCAEITDLALSLVENWRIGGSNPRDDVWHADDAFTNEEKLRMTDARISDLGVQLAQFSRGGPYGAFFEGEANVNFDNHFVVLELEGLKNRKALQNVILMLLMFLIDKEMRLGDRAQTKLVIIDEAWDLMGEGHSGKFIETGYRRARKQNGAFFTATQSPADYWKTSTAKAALENSDCLFLLRQKPEVLEQLKREGRMAINAQESAMLSSLTTVAGLYSEVFVRIGDAPASVNRLMLDPFSELLMSSHPLDTRAVQEKRAQGLTIAESLDAVLADRGKG